MICWPFQSSAFNKQRRFVESVPAQSEIVLRLFGQIEPAACGGGGYPLCCYIMHGILFGILEEGTKYLMLRFFLTSYDRKENTLSYGIGHSAYEGFGSAISCLGLIGSGKAASDILSFQIMTVIDRTVFTISLTVLIFYGIKNGKSKVMLPAAMLLQVHSVSVIQLQ